MDERKNYSPEMQEEANKQNKALEAVRSYSQDAGSKAKIVEAFRSNEDLRERYQKAWKAKDFVTAKNLIDNTVLGQHEKAPLKPVSGELPGSEAGAKVAEAAEGQTPEAYIGVLKAGLEKSIKAMDRIFSEKGMKGGILPRDIAEAKSLLPTVVRSMNEWKSAGMNADQINRKIREVVTPVINKIEGKIAG